MCDACKHMCVCVCVCRAMKVDMLKLYCKHKGLLVGGNKTKLVAKLEAYDQNPEVIWAHGSM
jgi:hypothetical protein